MDPDMKMFFRVSRFLNKRFGVVPPEMIRAFYDDYHRYLRSQGVDGVKVDAQSVVSWGFLGVFRGGEGGGRTCWVFYICFAFSSVFLRLVVRFVG